MNSILPSVDDSISRLTPGVMDPAMVDHDNVIHLEARSKLNPQQVLNVRHSHGLAHVRLIDTAQ